MNYECLIKQNVKQEVITMKIIPLVFLSIKLYFWTMVNKKLPNKFPILLLKLKQFVCDLISLIHYSLISIHIRAKISTIGYKR